MSVNTARSSLDERYRVLLEIGRTLTGTLAIDDLYRSIYSETARVLEASGFYISLYDTDDDIARVVFYADKGVESQCDITYRGSDSEVIRTGRPTSVEDRLDEQSVMLLGDEESDITRSAISAPLLHDGDVVGAISTQSYQPSAYSSEDLELLEGIADLATVAVMNARHVRELDVRRREAEQMEEIGRALTSSLDFDDVMTKVAEAAADLLAADGASVWLIEGMVASCRQSVGDILIPTGAEWNIAGPVYDALVLEKEPFAIPDLSESELIPEGLRTILEGGTGCAVPLTVAGRVGGALAAGHREVRAFTKADMRVLKRLAGQASVALDNARLHEDVQALSVTDPLTSLPNRRHLELHLHREIAAARRGRSLCVVIFDLDDFKHYNDTLGHVAGDEILRSFAEVLVAENREMNLVARFGGDEFVSVLSESDESGALGYLARVNDRMKDQSLLAQHGVRVSCGMALFDPESMQGAEELIALADRNMYAEKEARR